MAKIKALGKMENGRLYPNKSHGILLYLQSADLLKSFSQLILSVFMVIYVFLFNRFCQYLSFLNNFSIDFT